MLRASIGPKNPLETLEFFRYLFLTPSWGSKCRAEQQAYEDRLDETMKRVQAEKER